MAMTARRADNLTEFLLLLSLQEDTCGGQRQPAGILERFHNLRALSGIVQGGIFLRKMPLDGGGFGVQQLWNRCSVTADSALSSATRQESARSSGFQRMHRPRSRLRPPAPEAGRRGCATPGD